MTNQVTVTKTLYTLVSSTPTLTSAIEGVTLAGLYEERSSTNIQIFDEGFFRWAFPYKPCI